MGNKINPRALRLGPTITWPSKWYAPTTEMRFAKRLRQDILLRKMLRKRLNEAGIDRIELERDGETVTVNIFAAKPGIIIGRGGAGIETLRKDVHQ